ncbi:uncharacterized protein LOC106471608 [Limulus polyphemus]|uniref:Uncharacterized protein LOC106471608 n=1 Tax=Limulus polyphemus TaxID=6850 RepID=A0ABM1TLM6_LIMPO|nr:uncharacterized protein LOC106471608 [Limulus polyphemus]
MEKAKDLEKCEELLSTLTALPKSVMNYLYEEKVLSKQDIDTISCLTSYESAKKLILELLDKKGPSAFRTFIHIMQSNCEDLDKKIEQMTLKEEMCSSNYMSAKKSLETDSRPFTKTHSPPYGAGKESIGEEELKSKPEIQENKPEPARESKISEREFQQGIHKSYRGSPNIITIQNSQGVQIGNSYCYNIKHAGHPMMVAGLPFKPNNVSHSARVFPTVVPEKVLACSQEIDVVEMYHVAENIGNDWKKLARHLPGANFSNGELDILFFDHKDHGLQEVIYRTLSSWKERCPCQATIGNLAKALIKIERSEVALHIKK